MKQLFNRSFFEVYSVSSCYEMHAFQISKATLGLFKALTAFEMYSCNFEYEMHFHQILSKSYV